MTGPRRLRAAQVGVGHFGAFRRKTLRASGLFDLVAAYGLDPKALAQAEKQDGARPVSSYEELLDVDDIEVMVISTGAKFHAEQAIAAMDRGLHVFVEKPLCATPAELEALIETQKRTGVMVQVGHQDHIRDPVSQFIKQTIDCGRLGTISHFEKATGHHGGFCIKPGDWRGDPDKNPGGMLFQCGVHSFHELMHYFGPIRRVSAMMRYDVNRATGTADVTLCQVEFASGLVGALNAFHVSPYRYYFYIYGTSRNLYREELYFEEGTKLYLQSFTEDRAKEPWEPVTIPSYDRATHKAYSGDLRGFHQAIVDGGPQPYPTLLDGARAVAVVFAAEESAKAGRVVEVVLPE